MTSTATGFASPRTAADPVRTIDVNTLRDTAHAVCSRAGLPTEHAELQVDLLLEADLRGRASHGLMRLPRIVERIRNGVLDPTARGRHVWRGLHLDVDGQAGLGPVVATIAIDALLARAASTGVAIAAVHNNNHLGMLAWYAERVARAGHILIAMSTSEALVHPWGGRKAMIGTNPISIGAPTAGEPFVLDMATSVVAMGVIHDHANRGLRLKEGWALDAAGDPTTDAQAAKFGSLAPFGEAKGYALGLAIEVLVTALTGAAIGRDVHGTLDSDQMCNKGDLFMVLRPSAQPGLIDRLSDFLTDIRRSGQRHAVLVPGDRASGARREAVARGLTIPTSLWRQLCTLAEREP
jgi:L-2-hydroxycarboxylate dehydrogenase (NAD+)